MDKKYFTKERLEELKKELAELKGNGRIDIGDRLRRAKELGDLAENSEYTEAREAQAQLEIHIAELEDTIKNSQIIQKVASKDVAYIGCTITLEKNDGQKLKYTIVGSHEASPATGFISNESPLGKILVGKKIGDKVSMKVLAGMIEYKILVID